GRRALRRPDPRPGRPRRLPPPPPRRPRRRRRRPPRRAPNRGRRGPRRAGGLPQDRGPAEAPALRPPGQGAQRAALRRRAVPDRHVLLRRPAPGLLPHRLRMLQPRPRHRLLLRRRQPLRKADRRRRRRPRLLPGGAPVGHLHRGGPLLPGGDAGERGGRLGQRAVLPRGAVVRRRLLRRRGPGLRRPRHADVLHRGGHVRHCLLPAGRVLRRRPVQGLPIGGDAVRRRVLRQARGLPGRGLRRGLPLGERRGPQRELRRLRGGRRYPVPLQRLRHAVPVGRGLLLGRLPLRGDHLRRPRLL
ncbi:MAG: hypothetical protein AVDCRST_MAG19-4886, partial [uncultured Thermomicrobiales bacterium]